MKHLYLLTTFLIISCIAVGKEIDENTAKRVGQSFLINNTNSPALKSTASLKIAYRAGGKENISSSAKASTYYYVFNVDSKGFVIVAGDDDVTPILGYSDETVFDPANIPENVAKWLEGYKREVRSILENQIKATPEITEAWTRLRSGQGYRTKASENSVTQLMQTKWNQAPYYNDLCPSDLSGELAVTGCVATAMAQIMKYWNYPEKGSGFHSYNHSLYGTLSANFGNNTYQWASMPNEINGANSAIASLMYDVGVSVDMNYGTGDVGGSSAFVISAQSPVVNCSEYALKTYFGYKETLQGIERENYTSSAWLNLLKAELDASRPVLYAGFGSGGGHCFVADGYDNNNYLHFNWGWGGAYDGYFEVSALNPDGLGIGGGTGSYNSGQQAVIGIEPPVSAQPFELNLYNHVTLSSNPIPYAQPFTVTTNIANIGTGTFSGDYAAIVFDASYNFLDLVETKSGWTLESGNVYTNNIVFSTAGMVTMLPGEYFIGIFYRPTGTIDWSQVGDGDFSNMVPVTVTYSNDIELNSDIEVTPGNTLIQGDGISVNLNILNDGSSIFVGQYGVALYNLNGDLVETIDIMDESEGLEPGYTYVSPYLTFSMASLDVEPGTYLLAVLHKYEDGEWQLTGSTSFQNPITIIVQSAGIQPDAYEANDVVNDAYELQVSFAGDAAHVYSDGSNCHVGNDYDYYKIDLPSGYAYTIVPRLQDAYNNDDGNTYTLDALFSMSPDGEEWTETYDDVLDDEVIYLEDGGPVYFIVSPYFTGETGTYLLDMTIERSPSTAVKDNEFTSQIRVYPNPAREHVIIDLAAFNGKLQKLELVDATGQQVINTVDSPSGKYVDLSLNKLSDGIYFVRLYTDKGIETRKIIIKN